jgi:CheY-like chemotaxis protein
MPKRILLVDDNSELRASVAELLRGDGHQVMPAESGEAALELCATTPGIDLVVTDLDMPGISGLVLVDRLRAQRPRLAAVLITSYPGQPEVAERATAGSLRVLGKPFANSDLLALVTAPAPPPPVAAATGHGASTGNGLEAGGSEAASETSGAALAAALPPRKRSWPLVAGLVALLLAIVAGLLWRSVPPPLPGNGPGARTLHRGSTIEVVAPVGVVPERLSELRWRPVARAVSYRVEIRRVDDALLWEGTSPQPQLVLPSEAKQAIVPHVVYFWRVLAFDGDDRLVGTSGRVRFAIGEET